MPNQSEEVLNHQSQILTLQADWLDKIQVILTIDCCDWLTGSEAGKPVLLGTYISAFSHITSYSQKTTKKLAHLERRYMININVVRMNFESLKG